MAMAGRQLRMGTARRAPRGSGDHADARYRPIKATHEAARVYCPRTAIPGRILRLRYTIGSSQLNASRHLRVDLVLRPSSLGLCQL